MSLSLPARVLFFCFFTHLSTLKKKKLSNVCLTFCNEKPLFSFNKPFYTIYDDIYDMVIVQPFNLLGVSVGDYLDSVSWIIMYNIVIIQNCTLRIN